MIGYVPLDDKYLEIYRLKQELHNINKILSSKNNTINTLKYALKEKNFELDKLNQIIRSYQLLTIRMVLKTEKDEVNESK